MKFTKDDLKVGYLVEFRRNEEHYIVMPDLSDKLTLVGEGGYNGLSHYGCDLKNNLYSELDIVRVWGRPSKHMSLLKCETKDRELLWERDNRKEMTVAEIEKELGYSIKIVK